MGLIEECYDWWDRLSEQEQFNIMLNWYPTEVHKDTDIDKMFGDMPDEDKLWIYCKEVIYNV